MALYAALGQHASIRGRHVSLEDSRHGASVTPRTRLFYDNAAALYCKETLLRRPPMFFAWSARFGSGVAIRRGKHFFCRVHTRTEKVLMMCVLCCVVCGEGRREPRSL